MTAAGEMLSGRCLCGAVTFDARPRAMHASACHCAMCQRWFGGIAVAVEVADLTFAGDAVGVYRSSGWAERVFCRTCGTGLAWRMQDGSMAAVPQAAFDPPLDLPVTSEIFIDEKPAGYSLAGERERLTGAEVFAMFTAGNQTEPRAE